MRIRNTAGSAQIWNNLRTKTRTTETGIFGFFLCTLVNICKEQICNKLRNEALVGRVHWKEEIW